MTQTNPLYNPIPELDSHYARITGAAAFAARTAGEAKQWQETTRRKLADVLGFVDDAPVPAEAREIESVDCGDYVRRKMVIRTTANTEMPLYLLVPKNAPRPMPCMLVFHGHGYGVRSALGLTEDGKLRETPDAIHGDFAVALARRGFLVAAPEISCFGERAADYSHLPAKRQPRTCHTANGLAMMMGGSIVGLRVRDGMRVVDYLATLSEADVAHLGTMGISGGGMLAFFAACIDTRIKAVAISGYYCPWRRSALAIQHCTCNFIPGLLKLGEIDDVVALIAPRPMIIEHGTRDDLFPIEYVGPAVKKAQDAWAVFGAAGKFEADIFEGGHVMHGVRAYPFLEKYVAATLGGNQKSETRNPK